MASGTRAIAFDFGGSHVSVAIMSDNSLLAIREIEVKATEGLAPILPLIEQAVSELCLPLRSVWTTASAFL